MDAGPAKFNFLQGKRQSLAVSELMRANLIVHLNRATPRLVSD